jgi:nitroreductase
MDTLEAILERRSVRQYAADPIPRDDLMQILEAGRQAPSAANRQPWHFIVVEDPAQRRRVAAACGNQAWMAEAPCILIAVGRPDVSAKWYRVDVAIALQTMVLAARSLGYGTCWIGAFEPEELKEICSIPENLEVVACTPLGTPAVEPAPRGRKPWSEVVSFDRYGKALGK